MTWRQRLYQIIFESDTRAGRVFDLVLLWVILLSVITVILESIPELQDRYYQYFFVVEYAFTILFTIEYTVRVAVSPRPLKYMLSVWGIIDLLSVIPFYVGLVAPDYHYLLVLRLFRLLRVFRILKLFRFIREAQFLFNSLSASAHKIGVFLFAVLTIVVLLGTVMYVVEGDDNGFTSIPQSIYWTVVTITTVGYGDITPQSTFGKFIATIVMLCGYAIIAIPTGIVTVEMNRQRKANVLRCRRCSHVNPHDANYCNACGERIGNTDENKF